MALYRPLRAGVMGVLGFFLVTLGGCFPPSDTSVLTWGSPPQLSWQGVGPAGSYSPVYTTSIAFDPTGNLLCAVQEYTGGISWATVVQYSGGSWIPLGNPRFSPGQVSSVTLCVDRFGNDYAAFTDPTNGLYVMRLSAGTWSMLGGGPVSAGLASDIALDTDASGNLYVAYSDATMAGNASVQRWNGASWSYLGVPGGASPNGAASIAMGADSSGHLFLAYMDTGAGGNQLTASLWDPATGWKLSVGGEGFSQTSVADVSLAMDTTGTPWVAFRSAADGLRACVMKLSSGSWSYVGARGFTPGQAPGLRIALDPWGTPYVAYQDASAGSKAAAMTFRGSAWSALGSGPFSAGPVAYVSLAVSASGVPGCAYEDQANGYQLTVQTYH